MSRKPIIAGNWKMNKTAAEARAFIEAVKTKIPSGERVETVIGAPALFIEGMKKGVHNTELKVAAQNCYFEDFGAFTGENSPATLAALEVDYVIIGHSERRDYFHETDEDINKKAHAIFKNGMTPIICCGESLETYEAGKAEEFVGAQVSAALKDLTGEQVASLVLAYEPIWAIGTGKSATQDDAQKMCKAVRDVVAKDFGQDVADKVRVQYGGSVKPENVAEYMACPDVDGALVGGASLDPESFLALLEF
ncbi:MULTISPECIES: triose-phosphate isomerase [unclassified Streptococcus]|uniref:triose-phosphate isomerase n=1 Tax=unclassified Streptococcus TaxID=2608887 RepID=UPI001071618E|nr:MULTISPECIES: triose-phosphate isomerase [unclassified Streptococcus]MBF0787642.1 triose-phosphate isomerase [Streptococcus sp. 19428wC2_LYSM12]MCQ9212215.1 triose-phosphate isomerase [Streptococcus sp. B01]MCQ9213545.1 triose-phosphate isomerase [Streptococcus sp. O1]TFV05365.1 triose-phosphate isomerase [Streptococcus sp. LYSM12]